MLLYYRNDTSLENFNYIYHVSSIYVTKDKKIAIYHRFTLKIHIWKIRILLQIIKYFWKL